MDYRDKTISVIGAARSGVAAAAALVRLGARVLLVDSQPVDKFGAERLAEIEATGARFVAGASLDAALPAGTDLIVTSPGVPKSADVLQEAVRRGLPVWSEIELAYRLAEAPIVGVTGTNGKTTTTLLVAAMLQAAGQDAIVAGNISADEIKRTLVDAAFSTRRQHDVGELKNESDSAAGSSPPLLGVGGASPVLVAEISSFQLEWVERFAPRVGILTNVTPDHLNRYCSFEEYAETKARLFTAQGPEDWAILNYDNPVAREIGLGLERPKRCWFTRAGAPPDTGPAAWLEEGRLLVRLAREAVPLLRANELPPPLPGAHSIENVLAAGAAAMALGAAAPDIAAAVRAFGGVAHRMELVAEIDGIRYINNSMCTNVAAAVCSLEAMDRPTVVIAGGADKGLDYSPLAPVLRAKARHVVLIGAAADKMEAAFRAGGVDCISRAETLEEAVAQARARAVPGEAVLLSPACASFDMFRDFEARGEAFRRAIRADRGRLL